MNYPSGLSAKDWRHIDGADYEDYEVPVKWRCELCGMRTEESKELHELRCIEGAGK